jgi:hypothetical protein
LGPPLPPGYPAFRSSTPLDRLIGEVNVIYI